MDITKAKEITEKEDQPQSSKLEYSKPEVEELELTEEEMPEMRPVSRSGMGNCKHTYI